MTRRVFLSGIGGIGMANLAALLKQAGFDVSGFDGAIYEPAATVLRQAGITPQTPYAAKNLPLDGTPIIIGNAQSRGHVEVEAALDAGAPLYSFPEFLHRFVLEDRHSMVVAGTHGKSSTTACLSHLLAATGRDPGFLVGALPLDFALGAALGKPGGPFVLEGDEYDTAFFDKRSKFLHYFPRTLLLGIVEFDHADIFASREEVLLFFSAAAPHSAPQWPFDLRQRLPSHVRTRRCRPLPHHRRRSGGEAPPGSCSPISAAWLSATPPAVSTRCPSTSPAATTA